MIQKLINNIVAKDAPIVVGLDPTLKFVPKSLLDKSFEEYGANLKGVSEAIWLYNKAIIDATYDLIPAVKPQIAMYEQFGLPGLVAFQNTVKYCKDKGLVVIADIKRKTNASIKFSYTIVSTISGIIKNLIIVKIFGTCFSIKNSFYDIVSAKSRRFCAMGTEKIAHFFRCAVFSVPTAQAPAFGYLIQIK